LAGRGRGGGGAWEEGFLEAVEGHGDLPAPVVSGARNWEIATSKTPRLIVLISLSFFWKKDPAIIKKKHTPYIIQHYKTL
jgi:hypothetical protein